MMLLWQEGRSYLAILAAVAVGAYLLYPPLLILPFFGVGFLAYFFRDPERAHPEEKQGEVTFLSPADGKVMVVAEVNEPYFFAGPARLITIFLSPLDVHVNRAPIAGEVVEVRHKKGLFRPAFLADAPSVNERNYVAIRGESTQCLLVQIVGVVARRVVCWVKKGDKLERGAKFGVMKFGSSMQVFMPLAATCTVRAGERVVGGETVIGVITHAELG